MGKPKGKPKLAACTPDEVVKALEKLGGFRIKSEGGPHIKVTHIASGKFSTIPRHSPINKHLLRDFIEKFLVAEIGLHENDIYKYLWC